MPNVSIIIPTNNSEKYLQPLTYSILGQTYSDFEVIIVDNFSNDNTINTLKNLSKLDKRFKYYQIHNNGIIAKSRNFGIEKSNGKYIAFLDSDDYWHKEKLKDCLKYFPQYDFVYNLMKIRSKNNFYYNNKILYSYQLSDKPFIDMMTKGNPISTSSVILKKSLINEKKFFSEEKDFLAIEDFDCWIKLSRKNIKFKMVNSVLGFYNMSNYSSSSYVNNKKNNYNLNKIYLKNLKFIKNHKIEKISKNHFRYLMANNCRNVRYKLLVYKSLLFKVTPKISKFKLILKILFFQFLKND